MTTEEMNYVGCTYATIELPLGGTVRVLPKTLDYGGLTVNQIRALHNYSPVDGGDVLPRDFRG